MAIITRGNFPKALRPGVFQFWGASYDAYKEEYKDLFDTRASERSYEETVMTSGSGLAPIKAEGSPVLYDSMQQTYTNRSQHTAYALGIIVTHEEIKDCLYMDVAEMRTKELARSMQQTKEIVAANIYNNGFDSGYTFGDGKELFATDHPTTYGDFSNELATPADLSETALEDALIQISGFRNDRGLILKAQGQKLILPKELAFEAERILKSTLQNYTANNAINALKSMGMLPEGFVVNHFLTDTDAWFIRTNVEGLTHYEREAIALTQDNDFDTENAKFKAYERYSFTCGDPRSVFGSAGA